MIDKRKYPEKMYCKLITKAIEYLYGACSNMPYPDGDCVEYIRADIIPQWHDASKELPKDGQLCAIVACQQTSAPHYDSGIFEASHFDHEGDSYPDIFNCSTYDYEMDEVLAWMPIPTFNPTDHDKA